jgi:hypothetical protein
MRTSTIEPDQRSATIRNLREAHAVCNSDAAIPLFAPDGVVVTRTRQSEAPARSSITASP